MRNALTAVAAVLGGLLLLQVLRNAQAAAVSAPGANLGPVYGSLGANIPFWGVTGSPDRIALGSYDYTGAASGGSWINGIAGPIWVPNLDYWQTTPAGLA